MADSATPPAAPPATPPTNPPAAPPPANPPANPPATPPAAPAPQTPAKADAPAFLTADQVRELIASERTSWEAEHVAKLEKAFRDNFEIPKRRDAKIAALRQELRGAGKYIPADDDCSNPLTPGDLAALADLDDDKPVHTDDKGKKYTRLDVELARTRARLLKRAGRRGDDALPTPAGGDGDGGVAADLDKIRKDVAAKEAAALAQKNLPLHTIFGGLPSMSGR